LLLRSTTFVVLTVRDRSLGWGSELNLRIFRARFFKSAAASVVAASVALTACSGGTSAIPRARQTAQLSSAVPLEGAAQCRAALPGGAICGSSVIALPAGTHPSADGSIVATGTHDPIFMSVRTGRFLVRSSGVLHTLGGVGRRTSTNRMQPGDPDYCGGCNVIMGTTPGPLPSGAQMGTDGNAYDAEGNAMGWCYDCGADGSGAWIYYIGSTSSAPPDQVPYEGDMSPYLTAAQFADNLAPWFYSFALPIDIPFGAFLGRFGGRLAARLGTTRVGRVIGMIKAAVPKTQIVSKTATAVNEELATVGYTDPPFAAASQVLDVSVPDSASAASLNAQFSGDSELVRVTANPNPASLDGSFWTTKDAISNPDGTLMSAQDIQNTLALQNTPVNIIYGGQIQPGTELYVGIIGPQSYAPDGGGVIQLFVKSGQILGGRYAGIP
jgi:hypothetical protein